VLAKTPPVSVQVVLFVDKLSMFLPLEELTRLSTSSTRVLRSHPSAPSRVSQNVLLMKSSMPPR
jgi:hypothetical protein